MSEDCLERDEALRRARRRLLKLGAYVPPAVLGMAILGALPDHARAGIGSCAPNACRPCVDLKAGMSEDGRPLTPFRVIKKRRKCNTKRACLRMPDGCAPKCFGD